MSHINSNFQKTRSDHQSEKAEDYVEAIYEITEKKEFCRITDLAKHMGVSHVTVTKIIKRLSQDNLIHKKPYRPIFLTKSGLSLAKSSKKRHELIYKFLKLITNSPLPQAISSNFLFFP